MSLTSLIPKDGEVFITSKGVIIEGYNLGILIKQEMPTEKPFRCPPSLLHFYELDSYPQIKLEDNEAIITLDNQEARFMLEPARTLYFDYIVPKELLSLDVLDLCKQVSFAIDPSIFTPALGGIYFHKDRLVASDRFRLAVKYLPQSLPKDFIMPLSIIDKLNKLGVASASIGFDKELIYVDTPKFCLISPQINDKYPNYEKILKFSQDYVEFEVEPVLDLLDTAKIFNEVGIYLDIQEASITFHLKSAQGEWKGMVPAKATNASKPIRINISYLQSAIKNCPEKKARLLFEQEDQAPIAITTLDQKWVCFIAQMFG